MKRTAIIIMAVVVFLMALGFTFYPVISNHINAKYASEIQTTYEAVLLEADNSDLLEAKEKAIAINVLEEKGDRLYEKAMKNLYSEETNPVEIWVAKGDYEISTAMIMTKFVSIYGSFEGHETTKKERTILDKADKEHKLFQSPLKPTTNIINTNSEEPSVDLVAEFLDKFIFNLMII